MINEQKAAEIKAMATGSDAQAIRALVDAITKPAKKKPAADVDAITKPAKKKSKK